MTKGNLLFTMRDAESPENTNSFSHQERICMCSHASESFDSPKWNVNHVTSASVHRIVLLNPALPAELLLHNMFATTRNSRRGRNTARLFRLQKIFKNVLGVESPVCSLLCLTCNRIFHPIWGTTWQGNIRF